MIAPPARYRSCCVDGDLFWSSRDRLPSDQARHQRLVLCAAQAGVGTAQLALWTRLVTALSRHGNRCLVGVAQGWICRSG